MKEMEHVCSLCPDLLSHCDGEKTKGTAQDERTERTEQAEQAEKTEQAEWAEQAAALCRALVVDAPQGRRAAEAAALLHECLAGRLNCPFDDDNDAVAQLVRDCDQAHAAELAEDDLLSFAHAALLRAALLRALLLRAGEESDAEAETEAEDSRGTRPRSAALFAHPYFLEQIAGVFYDYAVVHSLHDGYAFVSISAFSLSNKEKMYSINIK